MKNKLCEVVMPTDRWSARVISPFDVSNGVEADRYGRVVVVHPGWAKAPERHIKLLLRLADQGFMPIGVDTRYAYSDRREPRRGRASQHMFVGDTNPYFDCTIHDNRWRLRRPTVLLDICERLGIGRRSYVGHSDGGRIAALATAAQPDQTEALVIVNGGGTGNSSSGGRRLAKSNLTRARELLQNPIDGRTATMSALGSTAYMLTHPRRTWAEKRTLQQTDTWEEIDKVEGMGVDVSVLHAKDDELISFEDCRDRASTREWVEFIPTVGGHSNVYESAIQELVIEALLKHDLRR